MPQILVRELTKRYRIAAAAHNLGRIMRLLFGIGKPRALQAPTNLVWLVQLIIMAPRGAVAAVTCAWRAFRRGHHASAAA